MKTCIQHSSSLPTLIAGVVLVIAGPLSAQTFTVLHHFTATSNNASGQYTNSDGAFPCAGLLLSGNTLYGTASAGGNSELGYVFTGVGTMFKVQTDGTDFTTLHHCAWGANGAIPLAGLLLSGNTLYGTTVEGGIAGSGNVFAVGTDGAGYTNLYNFIWGVGAYPYGGLVLSGNKLYGTTLRGGPWTNGTVFGVNTDGTGFTNLHNFNGSPITGDGASPLAGLILSGSTLYGTTSLGGSGGGGTVFALSTGGTGYTTVHSFTSNSEDGGEYPWAGLVLSGNTLYGTTCYGGGPDNGTVFKVNTDGTGFMTLHVFTPTDFTYVPPHYTNSDGAYPRSSLVVLGNTLYGTASAGGHTGNGTVFKVNTDGSGFRVLHSFKRAVDGAEPCAGLILSGNTLYGTASKGGSSGNGTIFSLSLAPQLTITPAGSNVILTWPTNDSVYNLEFTINLVSPVWNTNSPAPVVVNGKNTVTNPISGAQQFFRLSQ